MTQAKPIFLDFEDYLSSDDGLDTRCELVDGALVELPPGSESNDFIANYLFLLLTNAGISPRLIRVHTCELQVPSLQRGDALNRFPDLVVLREEHLALTRRRLTITIEMPPPRLVVEVVSPGTVNRERDYRRKLAQYQAREIDEYWIIDPEQQIITVFALKAEQYTEHGQFRGCDRILSTVFPLLEIVAEDVLNLG
jgi:Uma2 family endonuclease